MSKHCMHTWLREEEKWCERVSEREAFLVHLLALSFCSDESNSSKLSRAMGWLRVVQFCVFFFFNFFTKSVIHSLPFLPPNRNSQN